METAEEAMPAAPLMPEGVTIWQLQWHHCRWPTDHADPTPGIGHGLMMYCGKRRIAGSSYCRHHHAVATAGFRRYRSVESDIRAAEG